MTDNLTQRRQQEAEWQRMLRRTRDWILSHNDDGRGPTAKENPALALWIREQRRNFADFVTMQNHNEFFPTFFPHGSFTQRHIDQLNSIGFDWRETEFDIMFRQLDNFKLTHGGSCRIPFDHADTELVRWVQVQRDNKSRLDAIGFEWDEENINPNNLCSQCLQKKNGQPFQQQVNQQPTKLEHQQQQQLQQQQKSLPAEHIHAGARQKRNADEIHEYDNDGHDESDNDAYGDDCVDNEGGKDSGFQASERGRLRKKYNIDPEQFSHLTSNVKKNAIVSAIRAERRRRRELKRKKIVLFGNNSNELGGVDEGENVEDGKKKGIVYDEKDDDSSDNSSLSEGEKPPDYNLEELLSDDEEDPPQFTEEQILAFPVSNNKNWDAMFAKLANFRKEHGHVNVPKTHPDKTLYQWCESQRTRIKNDRITKAEMHRLESVGFHKVVSKFDFQWNQMFLKLGKLQQKVGVKVTTKLLKSENHPEAEKLRVWMLRQNAFRKRFQLSQRRIEKLDAIGFEWVTFKRDDNWEYMFTKLCEYKKEHGHCRVPELYSIKEQGKKERLGVWVRCNRKNRKKQTLSDEKIKRLDDIGFEWAIDRRAAASRLKS